MLEYIKKYFPLWDTYLESDQDKLQEHIDLACVELSEYITFDTDNLTDIQQRYILIIVKKSVWDTKHGDSEFENLPSIVKDYLSLIKKLKGIRSGSAGQPSSDSEYKTIKFIAKPPKFRNWFR